MDTLSGVSGLPTEAKTTMLLGSYRECNPASKDARLFEASWQWSTGPDVLHSAPNGHVVKWGQMFFPLLQCKGANPGQWSVCFSNVNNVVFIKQYILEKKCTLNLWQFSIFLDGGLSWSHIDVSTPFSKLEMGNLWTTLGQQTRESDVHSSTEQRCQSHLPIWKEICAHLRMTLGNIGQYVFFNGKYICIFKTHT